MFGEEVDLGRGVPNPALGLVLSALGSVDAIEIRQAARHVFGDAHAGLAQDEPRQAGAQKNHEARRDIRSAGLAQALAHRVISSCLSLLAGEISIRPG